MNLRTFEEFLREGSVRKQRVDVSRSKSLVEEAKTKKAFLTKVLQAMPWEEVDANYVVEACYDILLELVRAKLLLQGLNSNNSHEAEVAYMRILGFSESDVSFMNELRYFRNSIKYYGKIMEKDFAKKVLDFLTRTHQKLA